VWPFAGRERELKALGQALEDQECCGVVVAGAAGMGKSRLAYEFAAGLDQAKFIVKSISATSATSDVVFGALAGFVADRPVPAPSRSMLITALSDSLAKAPPGKRAVVVMDDAHLLDEASVAVLLRLVRTLRAFVLIVARGGTTGINALSPLWTEGWVQRLELDQLSLDSIRQVLRQALDGQVATLTVQRLSALTGGNPLLLRELIVSGLDCDALALVNGVWTWKGPWLVAPRLTELVQARLGVLDDQERWALELVALSEPVGLGVIGRLCTEDALLQLEERGLLWTEQDGRRALLRLAHPLYAEALRDACPPLRTRRAKRELSEALAATGARRRDDVLQVARWRLEAGVPVDGDLLINAAKRAWSLLDLPMAERLAREALTAAFAAGRYDQMSRSGRTLWRVLISGERHAELLEMLEAIGPFANDDEHRAVGAIARAETVFWGMGDYESAMKSLKDVEGLLSASVFIEQEHAAVHAVLEAQTGRLRSALTILSQVNLTKIAHTDSAAKFRVAEEIAATYGASPVPADPVPEAEELPWVEPLIELLRVQRELLRGRIVDAVAIAENAHQAAMRHGWDFAIVLSSIGKAHIARMTGDLDAAAEWLREANALHNPRSAIGRVFHGLLVGERAYVAAMRGEYETATKLLADNMDYDWPPGAILTLWGDLSRPWVSAARGAAQAAQDESRALAARARDCGACAVEAVALHDAVRLGCRDAVSRLSMVAKDNDDSILVDLYVRNAEAITREDGAELEAVAREFAHVGWLPIAIESYQRAERAYADTGKTDSARRCRAFQASLGHRCPGLWLASTASGEFDLTAREREVALLALSGRTHRQIADEIGIAKRTVDNHLARVYSKLSINSRDELRRFLALDD
jgi:DNA-binding CsgD family transcriptional regulator